MSGEADTNTRMVAGELPNFNVRGLNRKWCNGGWSAAASCCDTAAQIGMVLFENERWLAEPAATRPGVSKQHRNHIRTLEVILGKILNVSVISGQDLVHNSCFVGISQRKKGMADTRYTLTEEEREWCVDLEEALK